MLPLDVRHRELLAAFAAAADPYLDGIQRPTGPWDVAGATDWIDGLAAAVPQVAIAAVRVELLRSIVESELGTGLSTMGDLRARLGRRQLVADPDGLEVELALARLGSTFDPGVGLGRMRLPLFDPILDDLARIEVIRVGPELAHEIELAAEHLASDALAAEREAIDRRPRLVEAIHRLRPGAISPLAFDAGDDYGATMRALVETDLKLAGELFALYPLISGAASVTPGPQWKAAASAVVGRRSPEVLRSAVVRSLRPTLDVEAPPNASLPGMPGALRIANQRLVRGLLWLVPRVDPAWGADALADIGIHYGTTGRKDNTARDAAVAGTCAAMLGEIGTAAAAASLARMQARVTNRPVGKQIASALEGLASDVEVETAVDAVLPTFELHPDGRRSIEIGEWRAIIEVESDGTSTARWLGPDGASSPRPPTSLRDDRPGEVEAVGQLVKRIRAAITEERGRVERALALGRPRGFERWMARWIDHPIGRVFGRRLVWTFEVKGRRVDGLPAERGIEDVGGRPIEPTPGSGVRLWHPVDAPSDAVDAWRGRIVSGRIVQPIKQVFRESYPAGPLAGDALLERRFADRALDQARLRALMRTRGWSGPALGPWDGGQSGSIARQIAGTDWRAELDLVAAGQAMPNDPVAVVRSGAVRFIRGQGTTVAAATIDRVPPRILSEALRDVDLFTAVAEITRRSPGSDDPADPSAVVATRAAILRSVIPTLPGGHRLSVFGRWLRVEGTTGTFAVSLLDGSALSLPDETEVAGIAGLVGVGSSPYLPSSDEPILSAILDLAIRLAT